jgi:hypothetical protein
MWLEHLLVLSMLQHPIGTWRWGRYVVVHPAGNSDLAEACDRDRALLVDRSTFSCMTVEELLDAPAICAPAAFGTGSWSTLLRLGSPTPPGSAPTQSAEPSMTARAGSSGSTRPSSFAGASSSEGSSVEVPSSMRPLVASLRARASSRYPPVDVREDIWPLCG